MRTAAETVRAQTFTVLGGLGFIGGRLVAALRAAGHEVLVPSRGETLPSSPGHIVYAIGTTSDFRHRQFETVDAHVCVLRTVLERQNFESLLYLSSTRIYGSSGAAHEDVPIAVRPTVADDLYNTSKVMGESMCLAIGHPTIRVARLSNVYGAEAATDTFLADVLAQVRAGRVHLGQALASSKDYVSIDDVVEVLPEIVLHGRHRLYNIAGGSLTTHAQLLAAAAAHTTFEVQVASGAPLVSGPAVSIDRVRDELGFTPRCVLGDLHDLLGFA